MANAAPLIRREVTSHSKELANIRIIQPMLIGNIEKSTVVFVHINSMIMEPMKTPKNLPRFRLDATAEASFSDR